MEAGNAPFWNRGTEEFIFFSLLSSPNLKENKQTIILVPINKRVTHTLLKIPFTWGQPILRALIASLSRCVFSFHLKTENKPLDNFFYCKCHVYLVPLVLPFIFTFFLPWFLVCVCVCVYADNHPSPSIFAVCVCVFVCLIACERGRDLIWISFSPFHVVLDLMRRCIHIKQETRLLFLFISLFLDWNVF